MRSLQSHPRSFIRRFYIRILRNMLLRWGVNWRFNGPNALFSKSSQASKLNSLSKLNSKSANSFLMISRRLWLLERKLIRKSKKWSLMKRLIFLMKIESLSLVNKLATSLRRINRTKSAILRIFVLIPQILTNSKTLNWKSVINKWAKFRIKLLNSWDRTHFSKRRRTSETSQQRK